MSQKIAPDNSPRVATMKEVAEACGASISTVSRALRHDPLVAEATSEKVRQVADRLGYKPNPYISALMAQLRTARPLSFKSVIALIDTLPDRHVWKKFAVQRKFHDGATKQAERLGYQVERFWAHEPGLARNRLSMMLTSQGIRGVLVPPFEEYVLSGRKLPVDPTEFACVTVGCRATEPGFHFATNDQYATGLLAHQHLLDLGYRRVGLVLSGFIERILERRYSSGFRAAVEQRGGHCLRDAIHRYRRKSGQQDFNAWFAKFQPDAVCVAQPEIREWIQAAGYSIPQDIGLASLDWEDCEQDWSGVDQDSEQVGMAAVDLVVQMLQRNERGVPQRPYGIITEGFWVEGQTTRLQ